MALKCLLNSRLSSLLAGLFLFFFFFLPNAECRNRSDVSENDRVYKKNESMSLYADMFRIVLWATVFNTERVANIIVKTDKSGV